MGGRGRGEGWGGAGTEGLGTEGLENRGPEYGRVIFLFLYLISACAPSRMRLDSARGEDGMRSAWNHCAPERRNSMQRAGEKFSDRGWLGWVACGVRVSL